MRRWRAERGAVLLVTLVMLLLLTLIGLAGMRLASLEERMAGNLRDRQMAFQEAESALRAGELAARDLYRRVHLDAVAYDVAADISTGDVGTPDLARQSRYQLKFLRLLNNEGLEVGMGRAAYGVAVEVSAAGYGVRRQPSGEPVSSARLRSIYFIR